MNEVLLKYCIARKHLTTQQVAEALQFSRQALNTRFTGEVEFKLSEIRKLTIMLDLTEQEMHDIFFA